MRYSIQSTELFIQLQDWNWRNVKSQKMKQTRSFCFKIERTVLKTKLELIKQAIDSMTM